MMRTTQLTPTFWLWQSLWPASVIALLIAAPWMLFMAQEVLTGFRGPELVILLHAAAVSAVLGRCNSPRFAFLYSRGLSRDALWKHLWAATAMAVLSVWLPMALVIWTELRARCQDALLNPMFPFMGPEEYYKPWLWLFLYAGLLPVFHWGWMRLAQRRSNAILTVVLVGAGFVAVVDAHEILDRVIRWQDWSSVRVTMVGFATLIPIFALLAGRVLHRRLEVTT